MRLESFAMQCGRIEHLAQEHRATGICFPVQDGDIEDYNENLESRSGGVVKTPNIARLLDDDISTIGTWYLAGSASIHLFDSRGDAHHLWGLALWDLAIADATLFECVALLTLQKKRGDRHRVQQSRISGPQAEGLPNSLQNIDG